MKAKIPTALPAVLAVGLALTALAACGGGGDKHAADTPATGSTQQPAVAQSGPARIRLAVADGAANVSVRQAGRVSVTGGTLTRVTLVPASGGPAVTGTRAADGLSWTPSAELDPGTRYRITATATYTGGRTVTKTAGFTTLARDRRFVADYSPENGSTVGVGMPVSLLFDQPITDRAPVREAVTVTSSSGQRVVGHWFGDRRLDFRPEHYWTAGSTVTVRIRFDGVKGAAAAYGVQDRTVTFAIGRSQVSSVDAKADEMTVVRDGKPLRTVAVSAGAPGRTTYNGQMVISQKLITTRMNGATVGFAGEYDIPDVPHAMRLSDSGTFIHGNYWAPDSVFGHTNVSHGCVGLNDVRGGGDPGQDASWFYDNSIIGDVVVVKNSPDKTIAPDNGLSDWNLPWSRWTADGA